MLFFYRDHEKTIPATVDELPDFSKKHIFIPVVTNTPLICCKKRMSRIVRWLEE
jgi:hypothetical protein